MDSQDYYEVAWQCRANVLRQLAHDCDYDLRETLRSLVNFEQTHALKVMVDKGIDRFTGNPVEIFDQAEFYKIENAKPPRPISLNGLSRLWQGENRTDKVIPQDIPAYILSGLINHGDFDAVIELGCGFAGRLFETFYQVKRTPIKYFGGELTKAGQKLAGELAEMEPEINFRTFAYDHMKPEPPENSDCRNQLIFTCHSIEQVPYLPDNFIEKLCRFSANVTVVHFEPFGFQARTNTISAKNHARVAGNMNFNKNLYALMERATRDALIDLKWVSVNLFRLDQSNPTSVAIWQKKI